MPATPRTPPAGPDARPTRILVVEDDVMIAQAVAARLRAEGFVVTECGDGARAVALAAADPPDLVVLDLMLPGIDGLEVCRRLQADHPVPVIMLTARTDEVDLLVGLKVGADDYLTKPFSPRELLARIEALLRRVDQARRIPAPDAAPVVALAVTPGPVRLDPARRTVHVAADPVHLTATEFDLLALLAARPGVVHDRALIVRALWGYSDEASERTVDSHVRAIRRKLGEDVVRTVRGVGYAAAERETDDAPA